MSMIIGADATIATTVTADEVRVVNDATLTVTGTLTCKKLIVESGRTVLEGSGAINVVEEVPKPPPIMITMQYIMLAFMMLSFFYLTLIMIKGITLKKREPEGKIF